MKKILLTLTGIAMLLHASVRAQNTFYNKAAGTNAPVTEMRDHNVEVLKDESGNVKYRKAEKDHHGNARGNQYDLAVDGAFDGQTILVLQLYHEPNFDFELPKAALKEKGFSVYRYIGNPPSASQLKKDLQKDCQVWVISDSYSKLSREHWM